MSTLLGAPRGAVISLVVFSFFTNLLMLTVPLYMLQVFDRVLSSHSIETLLLLTMVAVAALLTSAFLETIRSRLLMRLGNRVYGQWGRQLLTNGGAGFSGLGFSRVRDLGEIKQFVANGGLIPLLDIPWIPLYLLVLFLFNPMFAWAAICGGAVIGVIVGLSELRTRKRVDGALAANAQSTLQADLLTKGADTIRALGMIDRLSARWQSQTFSGLRQVHSVSSQLAAGSAAARFVRMSLQIGVLGGAAYLVTRGELTPGIMIAGSILITRALGPLESMIGGWQSLASSAKAYKRLQKALDTAQVAPLRAVSRPAGKISVDRVTVIQDRRTLLNNVSLLINPGEMVAIEGACGAGKSTLARIMLGLQQPTLGKVFVDDIDLAQFNPDDLGRFLGYLAQNAPLFQGSIGENIGRMDPDATPEQIAIAGRRAFAHDRILRLPDGYETQLEGAAGQLPRGIRQQIAIARALYGDPRIVVFDEPENHLDAEGENALMQTLSAMKRTDITTIIVTHRPQILAGVDRVLRLRDGVVHAFGPPAKVLPALLQLKPVQSSAAIEESGKRLPLAKDGSTKAVIVNAPAEEVAEAAVQAAAPAPAKSRSRAERGKTAGRARPRPPTRPGERVLQHNTAAALAEQLTLAGWLDPKQGALGSWITESLGRTGERYLSRLRTRLRPLLRLPLQAIDEEKISRWRSERVGSSDGSIIERAMLKRRFDLDVKALRECLSRAVEWEVLAEHTLVSADSAPAGKAVQGSDV